MRDLAVFGLLLTIALAIFELYHKEMTIRAQQREIIFLQELVLKGANRDSLYREHMGKTLYIDNNSVQVGHNRYLQLKDTYTLNEGK